MTTIATILPLALVVGLSPLPVLPIVGILMAPGGRTNALAYLAGWFVTLTAVATLAVLLADATDPDPVTEKGIGWVQVVLGLALLGAGLAKWLRRPRPGEPKEPPGWMAALDGLRPRRAATIGALLAGANPKNLLVAIAAGVEIALLAGAPGQQAAAVAAFVAVGSIGVTTPVAASYALGARSESVLAGWKRWLEANSTALGVGILAVLGAVLVVKGLAAAV